MAKITLGGQPAATNGTLPQVGTEAPDFELVAKDLTTKSLNDFSGFTKILNIFPSVNTGVCATSVRKFNEKAASLTQTKVLCISRDLPFAQDQFCGAEGIENVTMLSDFKTGAFGKNYGVEITESAFSGLHARAIVVLDKNNKVVHQELVSEVGNEPNYEAALKAAQ